MVLGALLERPGAPVSKQELFANVWRGTVVSDDALVTCIQELRKALGDDSKQPLYIETRHRMGYRFAAPVEVTPAPSRAARRDAAPTQAAIAVLPFADMSPDRDQDFLCEGLAEELIDALTHIEGLRVAARTSSFQFRGDHDLREVGRKLGVGEPARGQRAQGRQPAAHHRAAHRRGHGLSQVVGEIRARRGRRVRDAGRDRREGGDAAARRRAVDARAARRAPPADGHRNLRMFPARPPAHAHHAAAAHG